MDESQQATPLTTSAETPSTTTKTISKRSAKTVTTVKRVKKQDSAPASAELMKMYGIRWGVYNGRRVLNVPSTAPANALKEVIEALNNERN